ncbi:hypothetical protein BEH_07475 [Priestia filamentosa]|uniref:Uncharacterized protein n=1 Tax=Priestia filamentosa TaxID=1402861 RepID=A0A0H4KUH5_9BACI|nr:hypothetical protein [Priestia filamentosa]AKO91953.1 hypothetical protein BEH_07475 [Priestia filamentosa]
MGFDIYFEEKLLHVTHEFMDFISCGDNECYFGRNRENYDEEGFAISGDSHLENSTDLLGLVKEAKKHGLEVQLIEDKSFDWRTALYIKKSVEQIEQKYRIVYKNLKLNKMYDIKCVDKVYETIKKMEDKGEVQIIVDERKELGVSQ